MVFRAAARPEPRMTAALDRPRVRPGLAAARDGRDPHVIILWDELRLTRQPLRLSPREFTWVQMFDGQQSLRDIQAEAMRQAGGSLLPIDVLKGLGERLDAARVLDSPRFQALFDDPVREPSCIGCYEAEPDALRRQLERLFTGTKGPGLPSVMANGKAHPVKKGAVKPGALRAALVPHIDYARGGTTYGWGFKEIAE